MKTMLLYIILLTTLAVSLPSCREAALFVIGAVEIMPAEITAGETATVSVKITNRGGVEGTYHAILQVNTTEVASQDVTLPPGASRIVTFPLTRSTPGTYRISVSGSEAMLVVRENPGTLSASPVPSEYRTMYDTLKDALDRFDAALKPNPTVMLRSYYRPLIFGAELLPANANRGPDLLRPQTMQSVRLFLDRYKEMGIQGVTLPISYPLYTPDFPRYQEYVRFFKQVASEVHQRGMKLDVEVGVIFSGTDFSSVKVSFAGLTYEKYKEAKRQMVASIIKDIQPDYLNLGAEPDTAAQLLGMSELHTPQKVTEYVNYVLKDLDRGKTVVAAGIGSWDNPAFVTSLAANASLDSLSLHVYPVVGECLPKAVTVADVAAQSGRGVVFDELWLYKVDKLPTSGVAASSDIFRLDSFSFWEPLDRQFLSVMVKYARLNGIEYISPFWATFFFGSLEYSPETAKLSYQETAARVNQVASQNIQAGRMTGLGQWYQKLIQENR
jgi:hypothetical protein